MSHENQTNRDEFYYDAPHPHAADLAEQNKHLRAALEMALAECATLRALNAELEREVEAARWIPVEESLPEEYEAVDIVVYGFGPSHEDSRAGQGYFSEGGWVIKTTEPYHSKVTHWRDLPALPELSEVQNG